ncbi:hypothetical protein GCM10020366_56780 [Saccharopolyspora gregorii]|uniref:Uncharacterized protein n=1 Tax=Saccharopolyspora gregorii TaxID=33914 RepID=A0ABP6RYV7_9PSEU
MRALAGDSTMTNRRRPESVPPEDPEARPLPPLCFARVDPATLTCSLLAEASDPPVCTAYHPGCRTQGRTAWHTTRLRSRLPFRTNVSGAGPVPLRDLPRPVA